MKRAVAAGALVLSAAACSGTDQPDPDLAIIRFPGRSVVVDLTDCGVDGDTVYLVGERDGAVLQVVVGVEQTGEDEVDGETVPVFEGDPDATGVTVDLGGDDGAFGAFGDVAYERAGGPEGGRPGEVGDIRLDGSHIVVTTRAQPVDDTGLARRAGAAEPVPITIDANCPEYETA